jgi:carbamoyl-phosphate synthase large subunit
VPLAKVAARVMAGRRWPSCGPRACCPSRRGRRAPLPHIAVKEAVLPFDRFPGVDALLGPEMRSTGEVMGIDRDFGARSPSRRPARARWCCRPPGTVFVSVANRDKRAIVFPVKRLVDLGFAIVATEGTADLLHRAGIDGDGRRQGVHGRPHEILDMARGRHRSGWC